MHAAQRFLRRDGPRPVTEIRVSQFIAAMSHALDLTEGQPRMTKLE